MGSTSKDKDGAAVRRELDSFTGRLLQDTVLYFPVRHHSPACAWHLRRLIEERRPASILIEGPENLSHFIPTLADPELKAPVALYTQFIDHKGYTQVGEEGEPKSKRPPNRFGAFYPLCDYSPEMEAIRRGTEINARIVFCDLDYAVQTIIEFRQAERSPSRTAISLFDERRLTQNRYLKELARRTGCRDVNELWDRLFENDFRQYNTIEFMQKVAVYCFFARKNTPVEEMEADGTLAREKRMSAIILNELKRCKRRNIDRPVLVVTGGFHTPGLILDQALLKKTELPALEFDEKDVFQAVIPYSYRQLDSLNGYAAGMPSPYYYQKIWELAREEESADLFRVSRDIVVELARLSREKDLPYPLSTADATAAAQMAAGLARFRGNNGPMREDILDGVRSSFTKGSLDAEGEAVMALAREMLCGDKIGFLPPGVRTHPLIEDFRRQAGELGLNLDSAERREKALSIYTVEKHRKISRLFRMLEFLNVPFAWFAAGPDFVAGTSLSLTVEHWNYSWSPLTESALVDLSLLGVTIREAVAGRLRERREAMQNEGAVGSTAAVGLILVSCRLGLHDLAREFVPFVLETIRAENTFEDCVHAGANLDLLHRVQSPLETKQLAEIPRLLETAYHRACYLLGKLPELPEDRQLPALRALPECREMMTAGNNHDILDADLFWRSADSVLTDPGLVADLEGGLVGLSYIAGRLDADSVCGRIEAQAAGRDGKGPRLPRFLQGLLLLCRELTWNHRVVMAKICSIVTNWDDTEFYNQLPDLRLAFADHTPGETDKTAQLAAAIHQSDGPLDWYVHDTDEALLARCLAVAARVAESLKEDGLTE